MPAAGLPWFVAPFGRDSLLVSLQNILIYPHFARAALEFLGSLQATDDDPYRDAEPGKILHELRCGELAHFKLVPHTPYYGTADATPLYLITLHAAWRATGDKALLERHIDSAENCLALLWQIFSGTGFPNQFFNDSWVVGFWRADHGRHNVELGRRASRINRGGECVRFMWQG